GSAAAMHEEAVPLASVTARLAVSLQPVISRALAKEHAHRHQTMAALRDELKTLERRLASEPGAPAPTRGRSGARGRRPWAALGAGLRRVFGRRRDSRAHAEEPTPLRTASTPTRTPPAR